MLFDFSISTLQLHCITVPLSAKIGLQRERCVLFGSKNLILFTYCSFCECVCVLCGTRTALTSQCDNNTLKPIYSSAGDSVAQRVYLSLHTLTALSMNWMINDHKLLIVCMFGRLHSLFFILVWYETVAAVIISY